MGKRKHVVSAFDKVQGLKQRLVGDINKCVDAGSLIQVLNTFADSAKSYENPSDATDNQKAALQTLDTRIQEARVKKVAEFGLVLNNDNHYELPAQPGTNPEPTGTNPEPTSMNSEPVRDAKKARELEVKKVRDLLEVLMTTSDALRDRKFNEASKAALDIHNSLKILVNTYVQNGNLEQFKAESKKLLKDSNKDMQTLSSQRGAKKVAEIFINILAIISVIGAGVCFYRGRLFGLSTKTSTEVANIGNAIKDVKTAADEPNSDAADTKSACMKI